MQDFTCPKCGTITYKKGIKRSVIRLCKKCYNSKKYQENKTKVKERSVTFFKLYPDKRKEYTNKYINRTIQELEDTYINRILWAKYRLPVSKVTPEIIEIQRSIIKIKRLWKQSNN